MEPMQELNDEFDIIFSPERLEIHLGVKGKYLIHINDEEKRIVMQSPVSGMLQYYFDEESSAWVGDRDSHDLKGLITRDMLRQNLIGYPSF